MLACLGSPLIVGGGTQGGGAQSQATGQMEVVGGWSHPGGFSWLSVPALENKDILSGNAVYICSKPGLGTFPGSARP